MDITLTFRTVADGKEYEESFKTNWTVGEVTRALQSVIPGDRKLTLYHAGEPLDDDATLGQLRLRNFSCVTVLKGLERAPQDTRPQRGSDIGNTLSAIFDFGSKYIESDRPRSNNEFIRFWEDSLDQPDGLVHKGFRLLCKLGLQLYSNHSQRKDARKEE